MSYLFYFIIMTIAVSLVAYWLNAPRKTIFACGVSGGIGYTVYSFLNSIAGHNYFGALGGTLALGLAAGFFARREKKPTTVYLLSGIIPLVPGMALYFMMQALVFEDISRALMHGFNAAALSGLMAIGVYFTSVLSDNLKRLRFKKISLRNKTNRSTDQKD